MTVLRTLRTVLRSFARTPGFALTVVLTLALGIGVATAMYSVVRGILLAPLPFPQPDRLVAIAFQTPGEFPSTRQVGTAFPFIGTNSHSFSSIGFADGGPTNVNLSDTAAGATHAAPVQQLRVSRGFLPTLGIQPLLGRQFSLEEDTHNGPHAALLSYSFWQAHFAGDPRILGRLVRIDGTDVPVVGVLAPHALADLVGPSREAGPTDVWQPLQLSPLDPGYEGTNYQMIARLRPGVSLAAARHEVDSLLPEFARENSWYSAWRTSSGLLNHFGLWPLQTALTGNIRGSLWVLLSAVLAVLLVACLNLAGLMVARTTARTRELAVRSALGASRGSLLQLVLLESLVLAFAGAAFGLAVAHLAAAAFLAYAPLSLPQFQPHTSFAPLVLAATVLALASMLFFGLFPALVVLRSDVNQSLRRSGSYGATTGSGRGSRLLIVAQVSLALLLLCAASLLWNAFLHLHAASPGIATDHITIAQVTLKGDAYTTNQHTTRFTDHVLETVARQPGVFRVAAINGLPFDLYNGEPYSRGLNISGWPVGDPNHHNVIEARFTTPGYLQTMGIDLLQGRDFTSADIATSPRVAILSETAARRWWPGHSPLGQRINVGNETEYEVVGISRDTHQTSLLDVPPTLVYVPLTQITDRFTRMINNWFPLTFVGRVADGIDLAPALRAAVTQADPELPITRLTTMAAVVNQTIAAPRFLSWLSGSFAAFTLLLAMLGLFGLLSYQVTERTREIAVRMALGATRPNVLLSFLRRGLTLTATGVALGLGGALLLPRILNPVLATYVFPGASAIPIHPAQQAETVLIATVLLFAATLAACTLPVHRAATTDPATELRSE